MTGLAWKLNRLRAMGAAEIAYRVRQAVQAGGLDAAGRVTADRVPAGRCDAVAFMENHDNPHIGDYNPQYETY